MKMPSMTERTGALHSLSMRSFKLSCVLLFASAGASACGVFGTGESAVYRLDSEGDPANPPTVPNNPPDPSTCNDTQADPIKAWDCDVGAGYSVNGFFTPASGSPEVHVVAIYASDAPDSYLRTGLADVNVTRTGAPIVLVLSAYEPTAWKVTADSGVILDRIILIGYHEQTADAPAGVTVDAVATGDGCDYGFAYEDLNCRAALLNFLETTAGAPVTSLASCYKASTFSLGIGACQEAPAPRSHCNPTCTGLPPGPHECKVVDWGGNVWLLSLENETKTSIGQIGGADEPFSSVAFQGDYVFYCSEGSSILYRSSLIDGSRLELGSKCSAITNYQNGFLVLPEIAAGGLTYYPSYADLEADSGIVLPLDTYASRIAVHGDTLYTAWHSTYQIEVYDLVSLTHTRTIELEGYNTWIWGMSVTDDGVLFLNASWPEERIAAFDLATGLALDNFDQPSGGNSSGLACTSP